MSSQTPNLNLVLPVGTENVSRQIINDNNTKIDTAVGLNSQAITNLNDKFTTTTITNCNTYNAEGVGRIVDSTLNRPFNYGVLKNVIYSTTGYRAQFAMSVSSQEYSYRISNDGGTNWSDWLKLYPMLVERQAVSFTNGKATIPGKQNYELINVHAYGRPDAENNTYNVLMFQKNESGNYILKNAYDTLTSSIYLFLLWLKVY